ncbi:MAG: hypothetical protein LBL94_11290 [Prevotellaceae bacterium]|jgi:FMN-dependent NADH-azoreductase|nr:hypothetical protein [Prevotellaceae bacterium]
MKPQKYITSELKSFAKKFPNARVRYEYDELAEVHVVEVLPSEVYHSDGGYISWERALVAKFAALYPDELLGFITDGDFPGIEAAEYVSEGKGYTPARRKAKAQEMEYA